MEIKNALTSRKARKTGEAVTKVVVSIARWVFLLSISYILLYPLLYMISLAFKAPGDFYDQTVIWVPKNFSFHNIKEAWEALDYPKSFVNTVVYMIVSALIEVVTCAVTAYGLARFEFKEKKILNFLLILTILLPTEMLIIPRMTNMRFMDVFGILGGLSELIGVELRPNLLNSPLAFYVPSLFAVGLKAGLFTYMYVQFFKGLPKELEEAASIDGAGPVKTFVTIVVPSSGVIFLTVTIFSVIWHWNETYSPQLYLRENQPLSVLLSNPGLPDLYDPKNVGILMACCLLVILPPLIMYCILQKQFIKSIDRVGIVG